MTNTTVRTAAGVTTGISKKLGGYTANDLRIIGRIGARHQGRKDIAVLRQPEDHLLRDMGNDRDDIAHLVLTSDRQNPKC